MSYTVEELTATATETTTDRTVAAYNMEVNEDDVLTAPIPAAPDCNTEDYTLELNGRTDVPMEYDSANVGQYNGTPLPFTDVDYSQYYAAPVIWAAQNGIINGVTPTTLKPLGSAPHAQIATILMRFCKNVR